MNRVCFTVILVYSTSYAVHLERVLEQAAIPSVMIPVPRHLSSDCGVCVRINSENKEKTKRLLEKTKVPFAGIFDLTG